MRPRHRSTSPDQHPLGARPVVLLLGPVTVKIVGEGTVRMNRGEARASRCLSQRENDRSCCLRPLAENQLSAAALKESFATLDHSSSGRRHRATSSSFPEVRAKRVDGDRRGTRSEAPSGSAAGSRDVRQNLGPCSFVTTEVFAGRRSAPSIRPHSSTEPPELGRPSAPRGDGRGPRRPGRGRDRRAVLRAAPDQASATRDRAAAGLVCQSIDELPRQVSLSRADVSHVRGRSSAIAGRGAGRLVGSTSPVHQGNLAPRRDGSPPRGSAGKRKNGNSPRLTRSRGTARRESR